MDQDSKGTEEGQLGERRKNPSNSDSLLEGQFKSVKSSVNNSQSSASDVLFR